MTCLLLGGGGFIGSSIVDHLLKKNYTLKIFERPSLPPYRHFASHEKIEWIKGDFQNPLEVSRALQDVNVVIHLISSTVPEYSNQDSLYDLQTNVAATIQLLNSMREKKVNRIIFISSGGTVYGKPQHLPITENHPTNPEVSYGITKLTIEKYLYLYKRLYGLQPIILRVANAYGERQKITNSQGVIAAFTHRILKDKPIEIWGDGSCVRDYIHADDIAKAFEHALTYQGDEMVFNIGTGIGTSLNALIESIELLSGRQVKRHYLPPRNFDIPVNILNSALAEKQLQWTHKISLRTGLSRTIEFVKTELSYESA